MDDARVPRVAPGDPADRPMSPHIQVWRWHITMACSILHRATGSALYVGALIGAGWALALAMGPEAYDRFMGWMASPLGRFVLFGLSASFFYHLANGIRHLTWDMGVGMRPKTADMTGIAALLFAAAATVAVWAVAWATGAI